MGLHYNQSHSQWGVHLSQLRSWDLLQYNQLGNIVPPHWEVPYRPHLYAHVHEYDSADHNILDNRLLAMPDAGWDVHDDAMGPRQWERGSGGGGVQHTGAESVGQRHRCVDDTGVVQL